MYSMVMMMAAMSTPMVAPPGPTATVAPPVVVAKGCVGSAPTVTVTQRTSCAGHVAPTWLGYRRMPTAGGGTFILVSQTKEPVRARATPVRTLLEWLASFRPAKTLFFRRL